MPNHKSILSLFCGSGGMDLGFENAGFKTAIAYDLRADAVSSWNSNRQYPSARVQDIRKLNITTLDSHFAGSFTPNGIIGGPPCQGFSVANRFGGQHDPRNELVSIFYRLAIELHQRQELDFIVMENVPAIIGKRGGKIINEMTLALESHGFTCNNIIINASDYGVPQRRKRFFCIAINKNMLSGRTWSAPEKQPKVPTVRDAISGLPYPVHYKPGLDPSQIPFHQNHWCMQPKSSKFFDGSLYEGFKDKRSFRTLSWDLPSYTASYGNREVHVHPSGTRRLSVLEAMILQGFPPTYTLNGTLSSQIQQVSEAVPPPLAHSIALSIKSLIYTH